MAHVRVASMGLVKECRPRESGKPTKQMRETPPEEEPWASTGGGFGGASKEVASDCIVSQLHYCRFVNVLLC